MLRLRRHENTYSRSTTNPMKRICAKISSQFSRPRGFCISKAFSFQSSISLFFLGLGNILSFSTLPISHSYTPADILTPNLTASDAAMQLWEPFARSLSIFRNIDFRSSILYGQVSRLVCRYQDLAMFVSCQPSFATRYLPSACSSAQQTGCQRELDHYFLSSSLSTCFSFLFAPLSSPNSSIRLFVIRSPLRSASSHICARRVSGSNSFSQHRQLVNR